MIVRSIRTPVRPGDEERRGNRDENRDADVVRHRRLHDVGRVGAEHHQLAVRHVDDAHDAERDRQADGDEHEHRAEAQAEEQRLDAGVERRAHRSMRSTRRRRPPPGRRRRARRSCRRATSRRAPPAGCGRPARGRCDSVVDRGEARGWHRCSSSAAKRQAGLDFVADAGSVSTADPLAQQRDGRVVERAQHARCTASSRTAASGLARLEAGDRRPQHAAQAVVRADLRQLVARRRCRRPSSVTGSIRSRRRQRRRRPT